MFLSIQFHVADQLNVCFSFRKIYEAIPLQSCTLKSANSRVPFIMSLDTFRLRMILQQPLNYKEIAMKN